MSSPGVYGMRHALHAVLILRPAVPPLCVRLCAILVSVRVRLRFMYCGKTVRPCVAQCCTTRHSFFT